MPHDDCRALFRRRAVHPEDAWVCTLSGKRFFPLQCSDEQIDPVDVAQGLSRRFRFGGQAPVDYTVAQHSVEVARMCWENVEMAMWGLLHDAAEAYLVDWQRPVKSAQGWYDIETDQFLSFDTVEFMVMLSVVKRFGLCDTHMPLVVEEADHAQLRRERRDLFDARQPLWPDCSGISDLPPIAMPTWRPNRARWEWLHCYFVLQDRRTRQVSGDRCQY